MIGDIIRFTSFLLPLPFMALFFVKTDKLERLKKYGILTFLVPVFIRFFSTDTGYNLELIVAYMAFVFFGVVIFDQKGWAYPQALSLSFCLVYFGSFLWEVPYHVYTIAVRGGIDGAFPLHIMYAFPMLLVYEKVKTNIPQWEIAWILFCLFFVSTAGMCILVLAGFDIWNILENPITERAVEESVWMLSRLMTVTALFAIYSKSTYRTKKNET